MRQVPNQASALGPLVVGAAAAELAEARRVVRVAGVIVELGGYARGVASFPAVRVAEGPDVALHSAQQGTQPLAGFLQDVHDAPQPHSILLRSTTRLELIQRGAQSKQTWRRCLHAWNACHEGRQSTVG